MTEAIKPIALHQDPGYFTKGKGGFLSRTGYAVSREFTTANDDGRNRFNTSELRGNAIAGRDLKPLVPGRRPKPWETVNKWGQQISLLASQARESGLPAGTRERQPLLVAERNENEFHFTDGIHD